MISSFSIKANAVETVYPDSSELYAYAYFISKGLTRLDTTVAKYSSSGNLMDLETNQGAYYQTAGGQIFLYQKTSSSFVTYPWIHGTYNSVHAYDESSTFDSHKGSQNLYLEFFSSQPVSNSASYSAPGTGVPNRNGIFVINERVGKNGVNSLFHYLIKFESIANLSSINIDFASNAVSVVPVMMKLESELNNDERLRCGLQTIEGQKLDSIRTQSKEQFEQQIAQQKKEHDEKMDTSKVTEVNGIADSLQKVGNEKTKSLLYPVQWAIDTAHNLASAPATGVISLPGIFGADSFQIDLTVFERELPSVWFFIQNFIRFIISFGIIKGIFSLFKGVDG